MPYADWNLLMFPDKDQALEKIIDLTMLVDIFPTGFHGCVTAGVGVGSTVYVAGAGPVGLAAAASAQLLGAAVVIVGDLNEDRLAQARSFGCETVDVSKGDPKDQIEQILGVPEVDCGVDAVGFEARGHGEDSAQEAPATVLNSLMDITRAGGALGIPGSVRHRRPRRRRRRRQGQGSLSIRLGLGWAKSHSFTTGQCPVMKYHRGLMMAILHDRVQIAKAVNATPIPLDEAPRGYAGVRRGCGEEVRPRPQRLPGHQGRLTQSSDSAVFRRQSLGLQRARALSCTRAPAKTALPRRYNTWAVTLSQAQPRAPAHAHLLARVPLRKPVTRGFVRKGCQRVTVALQ